MKNYLQNFNARNYEIIEKLFQTALFNQVGIGFVLPFCVYFEISYIIDIFWTVFMYDGLLFNHCIVILSVLHKSEASQ